MAMYVAIDPDVPFFILCKRLEKILDVEYFWVELDIRIDPLPIEINASNRITIVSTDYTIGVEHWDQHEGVELAEELCLFAVGAEKVEDALEDCACWGLTAMNA